MKGTSNHMKTLLFTLILTAGISAAPPGVNQKAPAHLKVIIEGRDKARVEGASVTIRPETGEERSLSTDSAGEAEFELPAGSYKMVIEKPGFLKLVVTGSWVEEGARHVHAVCLPRQGEKRCKIEGVMPNP